VSKPRKKRDFKFYLNQPPLLVPTDIEGDYSIAHAYDIDAEKYLLPDEKRSGKYEKFGYYCSKCDAYMTGQIQLVMVRFNFIFNHEEKFALLLLLHN
jgi:hypothetical protein